MVNDIKNSWKAYNYKTKSIYILGITWIIALFFIWQEYNVKDYILQKFWFDKNYKNETIQIKINKDIEIYSRANARFQVQNIANCIVVDIEQNKYTTLEQMQLSIHKCWSNARNGGLTWDIFVFDRISRKMIYDNSPDCMKWWEFRDFDFEKEKIYLAWWKEKWECSMHSNKNLCQKAIADLYNIWNTNQYSNIYWRFDDSDEWLESTVIPNLSIWFNWQLWQNWVKTIDNIQLQVVIGTQKDEALSYFENSKKELETLWNNTKDFIQNIMAVLWIITIICGWMYLLLTLIIKEGQYGNNNNSSL